MKNRILIKAMPYCDPALVVDGINDFTEELDYQVQREEVTDTQVTANYVSSMFSTSSDNKHLVLTSQHIIESTARTACNAYMLCQSFIEQFSNRFDDDFLVTMEEVKEIDEFHFIHMSDLIDHVDYREGNIFFTLLGDTQNEWMCVER